MVRQIILAGFVVFFPAGLGAQGRGAMPSHAVNVAPRAVMPAPHRITAQAVAGTRAVMSGGALRAKTVVAGVRGRRPQLTARRRIDDQGVGLRSDCSSAPGLGFDAVHLAATCGPGVLGLRRTGFQSPFFFPFFDGGLFEPSSPVAVDEGPAAETPQPETTDAEAAKTRRQYRAPEPAMAPLAETASSAPPDNEEFVFVRRDGTVFFAVAYSWEKGTLHYITSQGLPRTITEDALDLDATRQFNEQRGLSFRLPA